MSIMISPKLKTFMENLWDCSNTGVMVPGLGEIVGVRAKAGIDLEATIMTSGGKSVLRSGLKLFQEFPDLFEESA